MSRVVATPEIEAKKIFEDITEIEVSMIVNFFDYTYREILDIYKSRQDYLDELEKEYRKIKIEEARRLLGL